MRDHEDLPYIVIERRGAGVTPFLWGMLAGAAAALLLAPRSGAETQEEIRDRVARARSRAEHGMDAARETATRTRSRIEDQLEAVREQFEAVLGWVDDGAPLTNPEAVPDPGINRPRPTGKRTPESEGGGRSDSP